jgi:hypothetical protein
MCYNIKGEKERRRQFMASSVVALFGEAEKGQLNTSYFCSSLKELFEYLGEPSKETKGIYYAVQTLLYGKPLLYFRVREEGVSLEDYFLGLRLLRNSQNAELALQALFLPGVGSPQLIDESIEICHETHSLLIVNEADFYDYMTSN